MPYFEGTPPTDLKRVDPGESFDSGNSTLEKLLSQVFWTVMASGAVYYPFYAWAMVNPGGQAVIYFSYNGADYIDDSDTFPLNKPEDENYKAISAKMIDRIREYQG